MTATAHPRFVHRTAVTPYTTERRIVGTPAEVAATVTRVRLSGRLVAMTTPRLTRDGDGRVFVNVRYVAPTPPRRTRRRTALRFAAFAVPAIGLAAATVYAVARLVAELIHLLPIIAGALVVLLVVWAALGRAGVCPGLHCPGCRHGGH